MVSLIGRRLTRRVGLALVIISFSGDIWSLSRHSGRMWSHATSHGASSSTASGRRRTSIRSRPWRRWQRGMNAPPRLGLVIISMPSILTTSYNTPDTHSRAGSDSCPCDHLPWPSVPESITRNKASSMLDFERRGKGVSEAFCAGFLPAILRKDGCLTVRTCRTLLEFGISSLEGFELGRLLYIDLSCSKYRIGCCFGCFVTTSQ